MIELIPYRAEHAAFFPGDDSRMAILRERYSLVAYSALLDGRVIGYAGLARQYGKTYGLWAMFSDELKERRFWLHRTVTKYLRATLRSLDYDRIESLVIAENHPAVRWIRRLGFSAQGVEGTPCLEEKSGPNGEDCFRFCLIKEDSKIDCDL